MTPSLGLPLELTGQLVGIELILIAIILTFRHKYADGFCYPWQFPMSFFIAGAAIVLIVSEIAVSGLLNSFSVTMTGYLLIGALGFVGFHFLWFVYPHLELVDSERGVG